MSCKQINDVLSAGGRPYQRHASYFWAVLRCHWHFQRQSHKNCKNGTPWTNLRRHVTSRQINRLTHQWGLQWRDQRPVRQLSRHRMERPVAAPGPPPLNLFLHSGPHLQKAWTKRNILRTKTTTWKYFYWNRKSGEYVIQFQRYWLFDSCL